MRRESIKKMPWRMHLG